MSAGEDDDDHETTDIIRNYFIRKCKQDLYEGINMNMMYRKK